MGQIIKTDEIGQLVLTASLLGEMRPHSQYRVEVVEDKILLEPAPNTDQSQAASDEWAQHRKSFRQSYAPLAAAMRHDAQYMGSGVVDARSVPPPHNNAH